MKELTLSETSQVNGGSGIGGFGSWLVRNRDHLYSAQDKKNYRAYRDRRDRKGDRAARAKARSRSDMNSSGDQRSSDRRGGR